MAARKIQSVEKKAAKLGTASFKALALLTPSDDGWGAKGIKLPATDGNVCDCCGKAITYRVIVEDANGTTFWLGRACASTFANLDKAIIVELEKRAIRDALTSDSPFARWAVSQPHPKGWAGQTLLDDTRYWYNRGKDAIVRRALDAFASGDTTKIDKAMVQATEKKAARAALRTAEPCPVDPAYIAFLEDVRDAHADFAAGRTTAEELQKDLAAAASRLAKLQ